MAGTASGDEVQRFVLESLDLAGATYRCLDDHTVEAFVPVNRPPSFFGSNEQPPFDRLLLVFGDDPRGLPADAELVTPGSYRLGWFVDGIRKRGRFARARVPYTLALAKAHRQIRRQWPYLGEDVYFGRFTVSHEHHLMINFKISLRSDSSVDEIDSLSLNMKTGELRRGLMGNLKEWAVEDIGVSGLSTHNLDMIHAARTLADQARRYAEESHPGWEREPEARYREEIERLSAYYADRPADRIDLNECSRIADELREKFRPRLHIGIFGAALILLPAVHFEYEAIGRGPVRAGVVRFEPVGGRVQLLNVPDSALVIPPGDAGV